MNIANLIGQSISPSNRHNTVQTSDQGSPSHSDSPLSHTWQVRTSGQAARRHKQAMKAKLPKKPKAKRPSRTPSLLNAPPGHRSVSYKPRCRCMDTRPCTCGLRDKDVTPPPVYSTEHLAVTGHREHSPLKRRSNREWCCCVNEQTCTCGVGDSKNPTS